MSPNFQMFKKDLENAEEPEIKLPNICWIIEKARELHKISTSVSSTTLKLLTVSQQTGKFWKRCEYQTTSPASWETCVKVKKQQLELDMEQWPGSQLEKEYIKAVYCHPAYLTYMQSTSWEMSGWMNHKLESRLPREISTTSDMQTIPALWQKVKRN